MPERLVDGWAPVWDLLQLTTAEGEARPDQAMQEMGPAVQELGSGKVSAEVTTTIACMQEALHGDIAEDTQTQERNLSAKEIAALGNIKMFCAGLLKKLAPPLLKEFEGLRGIKSGQDPFTPRRTTRSVCSVGARKTKASAAETVLLKTLGFNCDNLAVSEDAQGQLRTVFDSPLQEPQLRAIAAIFGKAILLNLAEEAGRAEPLLA